MSRNERLDGGVEVVTIRIVELGGMIGIGCWEDRVNFCDCFPDCTIMRCLALAFQKIVLLHTYLPKMALSGGGLDIDLHSGI
jgi:hypothetical protein